MQTRIGIEMLKMRIASSSLGCPTHVFGKISRIEKEIYNIFNPRQLLQKCNRNKLINSFAMNLIVELLT